MNWNILNGEVGLNWKLGILAFFGADIIGTILGSLFSDTDEFLNIVFDTANSGVIALSIFVFPLLFVVAMRERKQGGDKFIASSAIVILVCLGTLYLEYGYTFLGEAWTKIVAGFWKIIALNNNMPWIFLVSVMIGIIAMLAAKLYFQNKAGGNK